ncbi:MAG: PilZ domain-containing protein [Acidobacteriota bacterium]
MAAATVTEILNTRSAPRVKDNSKVIIDGRDLLDYPFTEYAEVYDISQTGVAFFIKNRPWIEDTLDITIYPTDASHAKFFSGRKARGRVVRTGQVSEGKQFVAARFEATG